MDRNVITGKSQKEPKQQKKIIKRYGNRKLYDTEQSSYVVLNDIAKMIRNNEEICVIDNETKDDITNFTLTQIIFGAEKKSTYSTPLEILKSIIMKGDGSLSNFLAEIGLFDISIASKDQKTSEADYASTGTQKEQTQTSSTSLEERIVNAATSSHEIIEDNELPELPNSNKNLSTD